MSVYDSEGTAADTNTSTTVVICDDAIIEVCNAAAE